MSGHELESLIERTCIEDNKQFSRLAEKTQVVTPHFGLKEIPKNRASHSYEVATSTLMIAASIAEKNGLKLQDIDFQQSLFNVALLHDIGHPAFGHSGAEVINDYFVKKGLLEGFSDNNNNLVVIEKNNIQVRPYTIASTIKYPSRLYASQKEKYGEMLFSALADEYFHFQSIGINIGKQRTTIACQIMDQADRNSYICSDLSDFISNGSSISQEEMAALSDDCQLSSSNRKILADISTLSQDGSKSEIKVFFSRLKQALNQNFTLSEGGLVEEDRDLIQLREALGKACHIFYIRPVRKLPGHLINMEMLKAYCKRVVENGFSPSDYYKQKIVLAKNELEKMSYMRDMIAEVSDSYVQNICSGMKFDIPSDIEYAPLVRSGRIRTLQK